jgi:hypothetical protein
MEIHSAPTDAGGAVEVIGCSMGGCGQAAIAEIACRPLCAGHFVSVCTREIESHDSHLKSGAASEAYHARRQFLAVCIEQASRLAELPEYVGQPVREHLLEILRRASQMNLRMRRSPRVAACVPVWLRREDQRHTWEEETWTTTISRHGASFACHHSVEVNGLVVLCRRDKGSRVQARVVYCHFDAEGRRQIGVEVLDRDDFWGIETLPAEGTISPNDHSSTGPSRLPGN